MLLPLPYLTVIAVVVAAALWWWLSRVRVTPSMTPVAMMAQRIGFPGGIKLANYEQAIRSIENPDEIVIPFENAVLVIDYPLSTPAHIPISSVMPIGFTRAGLIKVIGDEYNHIYDAEEGTAATKTIPMSERGEQLRRNRTDGAYGIWGHDLEDLVLSSARWTRQSDGTIQIELHVEALMAS